MIRVYLDDERPTPYGWKGVKSSREIIAILKTGVVDEISLDHDLGSTNPKRTGYAVLLWIEREVVNNIKFVPPIIHIHTSNTSAAPKMHAAIQSIKKLVALRKRR